MTTTRYLVYRLAMLVGYVRRNHRLSEAASELHLLREAENYLGMKAWKHVESIEDLSVEYWNLRKLIKQSDEIDRRVFAYQEQLDKAHEERLELVNGTPEQNQAWQEAIEAQRKKMERLSGRREQLVNEARDLRRQYTAIKTKREVLLEEHGGASGAVAVREDLEAIDQRIAGIRGKFENVKLQREEVGLLMERGEKRMAELDQQIEGVQQQRKNQASAEFQAMSDINKQLSRLRAERGLLDVRMRQLFSDIGRHLSLNAFTDPQCRAAVKKERRLVEVMRALRKSVVMNHQLAGR